MTRARKQGWDVSNSALPGTARMLALEPRVLLDAALGAEILDGLTDAAQLDFAATVAEGQDEPVASLLARIQGYVPPQARDGAGELVFVDKRVADYQQLVEHLGRDAEVVLIEGDADGVETIRDALSNRQALSAIHIISHGEEGSLSLGRAVLERDNLADHADALAEWGGALGEDGDILLYGCNIGAGEEGGAFLATLARLSGADVAASDDLTGISGDWELEQAAGDVESAPIVDADAGYAFDLVPTAISVSNLEVTENSPTDTLVGTLFTTDSDPVATHTYALRSDSSGGGFKIVGDQLLVADGAKLDYETATSHDLVIESKNNSNETFSDTLTIQLFDAPDAITWTNGATADMQWTTPGNWDLNRVPTAADTVYIHDDYDVLTGVYVNGAAVAGELYLAGEVMNLESGSLTVSDYFEADYSSIVNHIDGAVTGAGNIVSYGAWNWSGGTHTGSGTTQVEFLNIVSGKDKVLDGRLLKNMGWSSTFSAGDNFSLAGGGVLNNVGQLTVLDPALGTGHVGGGGSGGTFINEGYLYQGATGGFTVDTAFDNYGTVDLRGVMTVTGGGSQIGGLIQGAEAQFHFSGGTHVLDNATLGDTVFYVIDGGSVRVDAASTATSGAFVTLDGGSITGAGDLTLHGVFSWRSGTQSGTGQTIISTTGDLYIDDGGAKTLDGRILDNQSMTESSGWGYFVQDPLVIKNAEFINSGIFIFRDAGAISDEATGTGALRNEGELHVDLSSGGAFLVNANYEGAGTLSANWGGFELGGAVNAPDGEFILNGGYISSINPVQFQNGHLRGYGDFTGDLTTGEAGGSGGIAPGFSAGIIAITGDWSNTQSSVIDIELGGSMAGTGTGFHDQINVSGIATLGGTLNVTLIDSHMPTAPGASYTIITGGVVQGGFVTVNLPDISASNLAWSIEKTATDYRLITIDAIGGAPYDIMLSSVDARDVGPAGAVVGTLSALDPDSTPADMTYTLVDDSSGGGFGITVTGGVSQLVVADPTKLDAGASPTVVVRIQVTDESSNSYQKDFVIHVRANQPPVATKDVAVAWEDDSAPVSGNVVSVDSGYGLDHDPDGDGFQVTELGGVATPGASVIGSYGTLASWGADGSWTYQLDNTHTTVQGLGDNEELWESFTYTITDDFGAAAQETLYINIRGTNDQPEFTSTPVTTASTGNLYSYTITARDKDVNDTLSFWANSTLPNWLQLDDNGNGTATLWGTPGAVAEASSYVVDLMVQDGNDGVGYQSFTIVLDGPTSIGLDNKVIGDWVPANTSVGTLSSTDPDSSVFTYTLVGDSTGTLAAGAFAIGGPNNDQLMVVDSGLLDAAVSSTETVRVRSEDEAGNPFEQEFVIDILPNRAPVATNNGAAVAEDGVLSHTGNLMTGDEGFGVDTDADISLGQSLFLSDVDSFTTGPITGSYGQLSWDSVGNYTYALDNTLAAVQGLAAGDSLSESFTYTVVDGYGGSASADLIVTIDGANDAPTSVGTIPGQVNYEGDPVSVDVSGNFQDIDLGDTLQYSATGLPAGLAIDAASGVISGTITDGANTGSPYTVNVYATDAANVATSQAFSWNVNDPAITATDNLAAAIEDGVTPVTGNVIGDDDGFGVDSDLAGSALNVTLVNNSTNSIAAGTYGSLSWRADGSYSYSLDHTSASVQALAAGETVSESFVYTVTNNRGNLSSATLSVEISGVNDAPYLVSPLPALDSLDGDAVVDLDLSGYFGDVDNGDTLDFVATGLPGGLVMDSAGLVNGVIAADASATGTFAVRVTASDGDRAPVTGEFTWRIANPAPVATFNKAVVGEGDATQASGNLLSDDDGFGVDRDPDGDGFALQSVAGVTDPAQAITGSYGTLAWSAAGDYTYTLDETLPAVQALGVGQTLTESFSYTIVDGQGATAASELMVEIRGGNDQPTSTAIPAQSGEDGGFVQFSLAPYFRDPDGDALSYAISGLPGGLAFSSATGVISGTLSSDASAGSPWTLEVTASDPSGAAVSERFNLLVTNPAPIAANDTLAIPRSTNMPVAGNLLGNDQDPDGDSLSVTAVNGGTSSTLMGEHGTLAWGADGAYTYQIDAADPAVIALPAGGSLSDSFVYTLSDAQGATATAMLTVNIVDGNAAPTAFDNLAEVIEDDLPQATGNLISDDDGDGIDFDPDGEPLRVLDVVGLDRYGVLEWSEDGEYTYTLDNDAAEIQGLGEGVELEESYSYTVSDGRGATSEARLRITIVGVNDAPRLILPFEARSGVAGEAVDAIAVIPHFEDVDVGDDLTFSIEGLPAGLDVDEQGRIVGELARDAARDLPYQVRITATDPRQARVETAFDWSVSDPVIPNPPPAEEPDEPEDPPPQGTQPERREGEFIIHVVRGEGLDELYIQQTLRDQTEQQGQQQARREASGMHADFAPSPPAGDEPEGDGGTDEGGEGRGGLSDQLDAAGERFNQDRQAILDILEKAGQLVGCGR